MAEFKLFGTQPNQASLNADLGTAAFKDAGDFLNSRNGKLAEIEQYLYSSAAYQSSQDIQKAFIYDTSLDTDGGAWRKRTHHTSWYNEDLNTAYRGSRREFPSVAIIIVEANRTVIYDGDDPEFPMWMVLPEYSNTPDYSMFVNIISNCYALNGKIGFSATFYRYFDFIEDMGYLYDGNTKYTFNYRPIADRNFYSDNGRTPLIAYSIGPNISSTHRDVVYKVYPGAKVDSATNLPMPTALIVGSGGFTLLRDHGSVPEDEIKVAEYIQTNTAAVQIYHGDLAPDKHFPVVYAGWHTGSQGSGQVRRYINPAGTYSNTYMWSNTANVDFTMDYNSINDRALQNGEYRYNVAPHPFASQGAFSMREAWAPTSVTALPDDTVMVGSNKNGIVLLHKPLEPRQEWNWMSAYINTKYNTGWMPGSCNLATLADTNTGAWYGGNLLQNSTFTSTSNWTGAYSSTFTVSNNIATITPAGTLAGITQTVSGLIPGRQYYLQFTANTQSAISLRAQISGIGLRDQGFSNQTGTKIVQASFTASNTSHTFEILAYSAVVGQTFEVSNTIFAECVADRSQNMNGVQVVGGNVERQKVGTGSDIVSYGPFSSGSYLQQSYNPDLDWNSSADFYVLFWWNPTVDNAYDTLMERGYYSGGYSGTRWMIQTGSQNTTSFKINGLTTVSTVSGGFSNWQCICYTRRNGVITAYKNGVEQGRAADTTDFTNTSGYLNIGMGLDTSTAPGDNSQLALLRLGNTYIDEAMAKKIFDDEQKLFARNAKAVLYQDPDVGNYEYGISSAHNFIYDSDYDPYTGLYHVVNASGRSTFNNLARVDHSEAQYTVDLDQRNSTVAARDGLIVEE